LSCRPVYRLEFYVIKCHWNSTNKSYSYIRVSLIGGVSIMYLHFSPTSRMCFCVISVHEVCPVLRINKITQKQSSLASKNLNLNIYVLFLRKCFSQSSFNDIHYIVRVSVSPVIIVYCLKTSPKCLKTSILQLIKTVIKYWTFCLSIHSGL